MKSNNMAMIKVENNRTMRKNSRIIKRKERIIKKMENTTSSRGGKIG